MKKIILGAVFCISMLGATAQLVTFTTSCRTQYIYECEGWSVQDMLTVMYILEEVECGS